MQKRPIWPLTILLITSCVEYRLNKDNYEQYLGTVKNQDLDPKLGPRTKLWINPDSEIIFYIAGEVRNKEYLIFGIGTRIILDDETSIEVGIKDSVYLTTKWSEDNNYSKDFWDNADRVIYIGGVFKF